jgi:hypothetical protein
VGHPWADAYLPTSHGAHEVWAETAAKVPASHNSHWVAPVLFWYVPGSHALHVVDNAFEL